MKARSYNAGDVMVSEPGGPTSGPGLIGGRGRSVSGLIALIQGGNTMAKQLIHCPAARSNFVRSTGSRLDQSFSRFHSATRAGMMTVAMIALIAVSGRGQPLDVGGQSDDAQHTRPVMELSLKQAVTMALAPEGNARVQLAEQLIHQAEAQSAEVRAALLPQVDASLGQQNRTINLDAIGIRIDVPLPGFRRPEVVGPFNTFDARARLRQTLFDLSAVRRFQASREGIRWARADRESTRDRIAAEVARAYLIAVRADSLLEAAQADVALAEALLKLAIDQKAAGTGTGIEVTRARVQLFKQRQRLLVAENERRRAHLRLLKLIGLDLDVDLRLTDPLSYVPVEPLTVKQALMVALQSRADFKAQQRRRERARLSYQATKLERVP
ncbi:MAG: TolC family protein, partial [Acidobacteria bacterium]